MRAFTFGPFHVSTCWQGRGAPLVDRCTSVEQVAPRRVWTGVAILLTPWRRDRYGASVIQRALVLGVLKPPGAGSTDLSGDGGTPLTPGNSGRPS